MPKNSGCGTGKPLLPPVKCSHFIKTCSAIKHKASVAIAKYMPVNLKIGIPIAAPTKKDTTITMGIDK